MEVVRSTWRTQMRAALEAAVRGADVVAIDTELTGLSVRHTDRYVVSDSVQERYAKLVSSAAAFALPQYGIATFRWQPEREKYLCHAFNVYLFPRDQDVRFTSQSSSLEFLVQHHFDFNKWIREGVNYADRRRAEYLRRKYAPSMAVAAAAATPDQGKPLIQLAGDDLAFSQEIIGKVDAWMADGHAAPLDLPQCSGYRRRIIYEQVQLKYGAALTLESIENPTAPALKNIRVSLLSEDERGERNAQKAADVEDVLTDAIGFSSIIDLISELRKPVIGHNMWLDLMHTFCKFVEPLPATLGDYKRKMHELFPTVYDTKYFFGASKVVEGNNDTSLGDLHSLFGGDKFKGQPTIELHEDCRAYDGSGAFHEAGFDAYCTGTAFLKMAHALAAARNEAPTLAGEALLQAPFVQEHANRLYNMRCVFGYVDLAGDTERMCESDQMLVHVSGFPRDLRTPQLVELAALETVDVKWIDDTSLFLVVPLSTDVTALAERARAVVPAMQVVPAEQFFAGRARPAERTMSWAPAPPAAIAAAAAAAPNAAETAMDVTVPSEPPVPKRPKTESDTAAAAE